MKHFINDVSLGLPAMVQIGQAHFLTGHKVYNQWFGYYDVETRLLDKVKMIMKNGRRN